MKAERRWLVPSIKLAFSAAFLVGAGFNLMPKPAGQGPSLGWAGTGAPRAIPGYALPSIGEHGVPGVLPGAGSGRLPMPTNSSPVPISPALQAELGALQRALKETLAGKDPLPEREALLLANWVGNLMLDAAYQDARFHGRLPDAALARAQVRQVLEPPR